MKNNNRLFCAIGSTGAGCLLLLLALPTLHCGKSKQTLHLYTWADYIKPEVVQRFETEQNCQVVIDTFDSNEAMYAKLKAGASGYDVIVPSSYMVSLMHRQGMLQKIDRTLIPNLVHLDPDFLAITIDKTMDHSVPYMITNTGIAYLKSRVNDFVPSWSMFDRADLKGRMTMFNDMRETIGAALKFLGYSLNSTDEKQLEEAKAIVLRWKKNLAKFENEQYKTGLASAEFLLVHSYSGDILQVQKENSDIAFAIPDEGTAISCDDLVIPRNARQPALAHAFINFLSTPAVAAENTDFTGYLAPNKEAYPLLSPEIRGNPAVFINPRARAKSEVLDDLGTVNALYVKIWDQIKAAE